MDFLKPLNPSISITGGEPTIDNKLCEILKIIDEHNYRKRVITTNGNLLLEKRENKTLSKNQLKSMTQPKLIVESGPQ